MVGKRKRLSTRVRIQVAHERRLATAHTATAAVPMNMPITIVSDAMLTFCAMSMTNSTQLECRHFPKPALADVVPADAQLGERRVGGMRVGAETQDANGRGHRDELDQTVAEVQNDDVGDCGSQTRQYRDSVITVVTAGTR